MWCSLTEAASSHMGNSSHRLGGGILAPTRFVLHTVMSGFLHPAGLYPQCRCSVMSIEVSLGQRWKKRGHIPQPLWSVRFKGSETTRSGCGAPQLLMCSLFVTIPASSSCLYHSPSGTWDSASRCSLQRSYLAST